MAKISSARILDYFARGDNATTTQEKGDALEELIVYLFGYVPGLSSTLVQRNQRNPSGTEEINVAL